MGYKHVLTSNKFGILETKSKVHNEFNQNERFSCPKQSFAAIKPEATTIKFKRIQNGNLDSKVNLTKAKTDQGNRHVCADMPALIPNWRDRIIAV